MISRSTQFRLVQGGTISLGSLLLILILALLLGLTSSLVWMSLLMFCVLADELGLLILLLLLKQNMAAGGTEPSPSAHHVSHQVSLLTGDDILRKFWEIEEKPMVDAALSSEERHVVQFFDSHHSRADDGNFIVPLPRKPEVDPLGVSRSQAIRRFLSLERSLHSKGQFEELDLVMKEYFDMGHAEQVPVIDMQGKADNSVFYLPIHAVRKESTPKCVPFLMHRLNPLQVSP